MKRMKRMSFFLTQQQMRNKTKTVTRRAVGTWKTVKSGDRLYAIEKGQGLKKGEKQVIIGEIEVTAVRVEPLNAITKQGCIDEGFPEMEPEEFVDMLVKKYKCAPDAEFRVIRFRHVENETVESFREAWHQAMTGQTIPLDELWD